MTVFQQFPRHAHVSPLGGGHQRAQRPFLVQLPVDVQLGNVQELVDLVLVAGLRSKF